MKRRFFVCLAAILSLVLVTSCSGAVASPTATETPPATATSSPTRTPRPTATSTPTSTPTPAPLTAAEVFERLSPSVVFVETSATSGSGVLTAGGYIVTNAHVVWPYEKVRVVFADGTEHVDVKVVNWDLMADLAILGPLESTAEPVALVDGEALQAGSDVFLLGYPGEVDAFPQPAITSGVISRLRESAALDITYFQTDARIAGGQSGGVLVSDRGEVIGISGLRFTEVSFGLVASAADLAPRIQQLIAGADVAELGDRHLALEGGEREHQFVLSDYWDARVYVASDPVGTELQVDVESDHDAALDIFDVYGNQVLALDQGITGFEGGSLRIELEAPYFIRVAQFSRGSAEFRMHSNQPLTLYKDTDDGRRVKIPEMLAGSIDYPGDLDYFTFDLDAGETIHLAVESAMIDPSLLVDYDGAGEAQVVSDDDSGGGIFGLDAELTYRAPHADRYFVVVGDSTGAAFGGYTLTVARPGPDAPTPSVPQPTPTAIDSPAGPMALYRSERYPFEIQYPSEWSPQTSNPESGLVASFGDEGQNLTIIEIDLATQGMGEMSQAQYTDLMVASWKSLQPDFVLLSRRRVETADGVSTEVVEYSLYGAAYRAATQIYMYEDRVAFMATYTTAAQDYRDLKPILDYSFKSLRLGD